jgi:D-amino-acid dehydrogenase
VSTAPPRHVVIIGGGVIGLLTGYYLRRGGVEVTVLERDDVGRGCSWGNLGWICPSISAPLPAPGLGMSELVSMLAADSPLYIKPAALPRLAPWLLRFRAHCNEPAFVAGCAALAALNEQTPRLYDELKGDGVDFEYARSGLTFVSTKTAALEAEREEIDKIGVSSVAAWSRDELREREPDLPEVFAGALHVESDRHAKGDTVCSGVAAKLVAAGGRVEERFDVTGFRVEANRVVAVEGLSGSVEADAVIVAAGAESGLMTAALGHAIPLQAGKGYSLSVHDPALRLNSPLYLCDAKVGLTPYEGMLRVGGTMELSGINRSLDPRRVESIRRVVTGVIPRALEGTGVEEWVGMRPLTPDGLPVIGRLPNVPNAFVASGHQMLGVTLAPSTGRALADLVLGDRSAIDLAPFDPARFRFSRRHRRLRRVAVDS